jgi:dolichyl-phosphate-mannose-protein mannosyltransferase
VTIVRQSFSVPNQSIARNAVVAIVLFLLAHLALLVGVTTPDKFYFDEVHYVPAARQMLEPVMPTPMLNPMHPPLAKQLIALSILTFGDVPLGWRYPAALFGALAIVAMYFCGLALFVAQGPAVASALLAFFNQMLFVQSRIAMLDIFALAFGLFGIAAFMHGFRQPRPQRWFAAAGLACGLSSACKWSGLFTLATCIVIVALIRLMQNWRTQFAVAMPVTGTGRSCGRISSWCILPCASSSFPPSFISRPSSRFSDGRFQTSWRRNSGSSATTPRQPSPATPI